MSTHHSSCLLCLYAKITCICPTLPWHSSSNQTGVVMQAAVVLRAPDTAVSGSASKPLAEGGALAGADIGLVAIVQARRACIIWKAHSLF